jgi:ribosome-associated protein
MRAFVADGMVAPPRMWNSIMLEIIGKTQIHESELLFRASRSSGPGGQNVNKLNTRMTLLFDVAGSPSLSDEQKRRVRTALSTRIDKQGVLRVASQRFRTQEANRQAAIERFVQLLAEVLTPRPVRRKTKAPAGAREQRLRDKKHRSRLKQQRSDKGWEL